MRNNLAIPAGIILPSKMELHFMMMKYVIAFPARMHRWYKLVISILAGKIGKLKEEKTRLL